MSGLRMWRELANVSRRQARGKGGIYSDTEQFTGSIVAWQHLLYS